MFSKISLPLPSKIPELKISNPKIPWIISIALKLEYTPPWIYGLVLYDPIYCTVGRVSWAGFKGPVKLSGESIPSDEGGGARSSNPEIRGGGRKKNFFRASVWSKKKGEAWVPQALPLDPALKLTVFELYFIVRNV